MTSMQQARRQQRVIVGVTTHKFVHVAVAQEHDGAVLGEGSFTANAGGHQELIEWALNFGGMDVTFAIKGQGSDGAGLVGAIRRRACNSDLEHATSAWISWYDSDRLTHRSGRPLRWLAARHPARHRRLDEREDRRVPAPPIAPEWHRTTGADGCAHRWSVA